MSKLARHAAALAIVFAFAESDFEPARFRSGDLPVQPPMIGGHGQVLLELHVNASGSVTNVVPLRSTPPFTDLVVDAVREWQFSPARQTDEETDTPNALETRVLVAALFRPPTTFDAPARGEAPEDVASASEEVPFPRSMVTPVHPPTVRPHIGQVVLVEVQVGVDGNVDNARSIRSMAGFESASTDAARQWKFRPARRNGKAVPSFVYIVFGFRDPVGPPVR